MPKKISDIYSPQVEKTKVILPTDNPAPAASPPPTLSAAPSPRRSFRRYFGILGPGIITGASDDDPSGIGTYSVAGAQFGYQTLWLSLLTYPLSAAVQEVCARIGLVTGHGLASVTKKYYGKLLLFFVAFLLVGANTINIGADVQAMAATLRLLAPGIDFSLAALGITVFTLLFLIALSYKSYARFLKIATLVLFSYVFVAFLSRVDWGNALHDFIIPTFSFQPDYLLTLVGILGTTISPYMFFWQANEEVEEEISKGIIRKDAPATVHPTLRHISRALIKDMYIDVNVGMFYSELIMFFIIVATAANLYAKQGTISFSNLSLDQMASVLRPLVGDTAFLLFAIGILGVGLLAIPVLAGSASYAISELFGWEEGLNKKFHEAKGFYLVIIIATLLGLGLNFIGVPPVAALFYTAVINGIIAVPLLLVIWRVGNNKQALGDHTSGKLSNFLVVLTIIIMGLAALATLFIH